jgi:hypothetical protein
LRFEFYPLRFEFRALEPIRFPEGKAANTLRGGLGLAFRRIACSPECARAAGCERRAVCAYARIFEPAASGSDAYSPSGLADWPRPFVFRARHLDGKAFLAGDAFCFDLNLFCREREATDYFAQSFAALGREGLGPERGRAELVSAPANGLLPISLDLCARPDAPSRVRVEFLSPTELKNDRGLVERPEFPVLFRRIRDRISTLGQLYGEGALELDFRGSGARAAEVRMTRCEMRHVEVRRRSGRTGQSHSIGGFVGMAEYEGDLREFLPYLEAAQWTGVGRQAVWGKGEIRVAEAPRS